MHPFTQRLLPVIATHNKRSNHVKSRQMEINQTNRILQRPSPTYLNVSVVLFGVPSSS